MLRFRRAVTESRRTGALRPELPPSALGQDAIQPALRAADPAASSSSSVPSPDVTPSETLPAAAPAWHAVLSLPFARSAPPDHSQHVRPQTSAVTVASLAPPSPGIVLSADEEPDKYASDERMNARGFRFNAS